jgi:uncharacterized protein
MFAKPLKWFFLVFVLFYRVAISPILGGACRFEPSCSVYAEEVLKKFPLIQAFKLIFIRLIKCRPGGPFGLDPVPECESKNG